MAALTASWSWGDLDLTDSPFAFAFGSDFGAPQTATEALAQLLLDGEIEVSERASNRTLAFTVFIDSTDLLAAAEAERLLALEADKARNTLTYNPGDGYGPETVFETFRAQLSFVRDDNGETSGLRRYDVTMKASPFGRSADLVVSPAVSVPSTTPTVTSINAGTSTTGWSRSPAGTLTIDSGVLLAGNGNPTVIYTPPTPLDLTSTRIISLVMARRVYQPPASYFTANLLKSPTLAVNGQAAELLQVVAVTSTTARYYWRVPASMIATTFAFTTAETAPYAGARLSSLQRQDVPPVMGTARQKQRSVAVAGSARSQGSLAVEHETSALGSTLVYTWLPDEAPGYSPPLRPYRVSGSTVTPDSSLVSGYYDLLDTATVFDVPITALIDGTHQLVVRVKSDVTGDRVVNYSAQVRVGSNNIGTATTGARTIPFGTAGTWRYVVLNRMMLPLVDVPDGSTAVVRISIVADDPTGTNINLDEAWLFNTTVGDLTWVECGTASPSAGGSSNRLWLDTATVDLPRPTIYKGFSVDRTDATFPDSVPSFGIHRLTPPLTNVFTVTSNALDAAVSLSHHPAWHTHAAS